MISDRIENWTQYFKGDIWKKIFEYIQSLDENSPEIVTELMGKKLYSGVTSYKTINRELGKPESHKDFIDIQFSIVNEERIDWYPLSKGFKMYLFNKEKDTFFYEINEDPIISIRNLPGIFTVFFPNDIHVPKLNVDKPQVVKKAVVKIHKSLLDMEDVKK